MESKLLPKVKKILIEFLVIIFVIGFFSKSFVNYFLPRVNSALAFSGGYEINIPIEGYLDYKEIFKVRLASKVVIDEIFFEVGDRVKEGEALFRIDPNYEIKDQNIEIKELELQLQRELNNLEKPNETYYLEEKINILNNTLDQEKELLKALEDAYALGEVERQQLIMQSLNISQLELAIFNETVALQNEQRKIEFTKNEAEIKIEILQNEIERIRRNSQFFSKLSKDGIYYSEVSGVVLGTVNRNQIISPEETIIEIALGGNDYNTLKYIGYIDEKYAQHFGTINVFSINLLNSKDSLRVNVTDIYPSENLEMLTLEGNITNEIPSRVVVKRKYKGEIKKLERGTFIIPKSAVISNELKEGETGKVYLVQTTQGILGRQQIAQEVEVEIIGVGNSFVSVNGLEAYDNPRVITNLSYKIRDGVRVFHGN